jgi:hypothetical protein
MMPRSFFACYRQVERIPFSINSLAFFSPT